MVEASVWTVRISDVPVNMTEVRRAAAPRFQQYVNHEMIASRICACVVERLILALAHRLMRRANQTKSGEREGGRRSTQASLATRKRHFAAGSIKSTRQDGEGEAVDGAVARSRSEGAHPWTDRANFLHEFEDWSF
eukprot:6210349-Pleurochrysis_carterae.AAC.1